MMQVCSKCGIEKSEGDFHYRKDSKKFRSGCKVCWKYLQATRRYGITFEQAVDYYKQPSCMCCGKIFSTMRDRNLHHVNHTVRGIVCKDCNILLRQETEEDLHNLKSCLAFMQKSRKNLFDKVNPQGSRSEGTRCGPSTTTRRGPLRTCKCCNKQLSLKHFYQQKYISGKIGHYTACKSCFKILVKTYKYNLTFDQVSFLRSQLACQCCGKEFKTNNPYLHHVGDSVLGVVCRECNLMLGQETEDEKRRLRKCIEFLMGYDIVCSAPKVAEVSRND